MQFLSGASLLTAMNGQPITKEAVLWAIEKTSDDVERVLLDLLPEVRTFKAMDPQTHHWAYQFRLYCERPNLSIMHVGQVFHAADLLLLPQEPRILSPALRSTPVSRSSRVR